MTKSFSFSMLLLAASASTAVAQTGAPLLVEPMKDDQRLELQTRGYYFENVGTDGSYDAQLNMYSAQGRYRLMPRERFDPRVGFDALYLDFNSDSPVIPDRAVDHSVGFSMGLVDYEGWLGGISVGVGYASTNTYNDGNAMYGKATFGIGRRLDDKSYLALALDYDGNRSIFPDIPLPAFIYTYQWTDELELAVGVPFAHIKWTPNDKFTATLRYLIPEEIEADIGYKVASNVELFASLAGQRRGFHDNDLADSSDRIFFIQRRAEGGLRLVSSDQFEFVVAAGYAFHQSLEVGFDMRDTDRLSELSDAVYGRFGLTFRY